MADFPVDQLERKESPSLYSRKALDVSFRAESDGGYKFKRRKFTRAPRSIIETGFKHLSDADKTILEGFYNSHLTDTAFQYYDYLADEYVQVTFDEPIDFDYVGVGTNMMWNCKIKMEEI